MKSVVFSGIVYALGFIGLVSFGLVLCSVRQAIKNWSEVGTLYKFFFLFLHAAFLALAGGIALRVFRCLTSSYCGPGVASGWIYLAILGLAYLGLMLGVRLITYLTLRRSAAIQKHVLR